MQYVAPLDWMVHQVATPPSTASLQDMADMLAANPLASLEMLVVSNTSSSPLLLGLPTVLLLLERCPALAVLGGLATWRAIDFYDPESAAFYTSDSQLSALKRRAAAANWDIDFSVENLDAAYRGRLK